MAHTNQTGSEYPRVNSEGRVRVRIKAPEANNVLLDISGGTLFVEVMAGSGSSGLLQANDAILSINDIIYAICRKPGCRFSEQIPRW